MHIHTHPHVHSHTAVYYTVFRSRGGTAAGFLAREKIMHKSARTPGAICMRARLLFIISLDAPRARARARSKAVRGRLLLSEILINRGRARKLNCVFLFFPFSFN